MPPIHPSLVHFPVALVTLSVVADLLGYVGASSMLRATGWWALAGAAIGAALAVPAGLFDMRRENIGHDAHQRVHTHLKVGLALFTAIAGLTIWRWFIYTGTYDGPGWGYLVAACVVLALTFFQGWLGGELVYADGVGVGPTGQGTERSDSAKAANAGGDAAKAHSKH